MLCNAARLFLKKGKNSNDTSLSCEDIYVIYLK